MVLVLRAQGVQSAHRRGKAQHHGGLTGKRCAPCHALQRRETVLALGAAIFLTDANSSQAGVCVYPQYPPVPSQRIEPAVCGASNLTASIRHVHPAAVRNHCRHDSGALHMRAWAAFRCLITDAHHQGLQGLQNLNRTAVAVPWQQPCNNEQLVC